MAKAEKAKIKKVQKTRIRRAPRKRGVGVNGLLEAAKIHIDAMEQELAKLRVLRPLLTLHPEALQALLDIVPYMRRKMGRPER